MAGGPSLAEPDRPLGRVLVAGAGGMLGRAVVAALASAGVEAVGLDRAALDVTSAPACQEAVGDLRPELVVNCAAYTKVDLAEDEPDLANLVNGRGAGHLAAAAAAQGAGVVYFSTDFVFDGRKGAPYVESDPPAPLSAYGRSKWAGEEATRAANPEHLILRTAWLFGPHGPNFVSTMLRLARERDQLRVVDDQVGSPTYTLDLAAALAAALPGLLSRRLSGVFHLTNQGSTTWLGLAQRALDRAGLNVDLGPTTSARYGAKAIRPACSVLDCGRLAGLGVSLRPWTEAVDEYVDEYGDEHGDQWLTKD